MSQVEVMYSCRIYLENIFKDLLMEVDKNYIGTVDPVTLNSCSTENYNCT
jgi:hypothetical protein